MIGFKKACPDSGHIHTKTLLLAREATAAPECSNRSKITWELGEVDDKNISEAELTTLSSFCWRSFSAQLDGKVKTMPK